MFSYLVTGKIIHLFMDSYSISHTCKASYGFSNSFCYNTRKYTGRQNVKEELESRYQNNTKHFIKIVIKEGQLATFACFWKWSLLVGNCHWLNVIFNSDINKCCLVALICDMLFSLSIISSVLFLCHYSGLKT